MRPKKSKVKKQKRKTHKKNKVHRNNKLPCCIHNVETSDFDSINQIIRDHKYQLKDVKKKWKVVPKDSCEVYKNRRKRQVDENMYERDNEQRQDKNEQKPKGNRGRRPLKRDSRGRFLPESSKCSCCTRSNSDTESTYTRSEPAD